MLVRGVFYIGAGAENKVPKSTHELKLRIYFGSYTTRTHSIGMCVKVQ